MRKNKSRFLILQRILAVLYFTSGILKPFPDLIAEGFPENISKMLILCAENNAGTFLESSSNWFAAHPGFVTAAVMAGMLAIAFAYWWNKALVKSAAIANIVMLSLFSLYLHRTVMMVIVVDILFAIPAFFIIYQQIKKKMRIHIGHRVL